MTVPNSPPGTLRLVRGTPNSNGAENAELFLLVGDPTIAPIREIIPDEGVTLPQPSVDLTEQRFRLCILHFNDLHGHISRITPYGDRPVFSRIVWRLREVRRRCKNDPRTAVLAMSAGDDLIGAVFDELLGDAPNSYAVHAGYHLYSQAGIDVGVLGNHDLDMGTRLLAQAIRCDARFPLLSANLVGSRRLAKLYHPAALLVVKGIRVGIMGLTTPGEVKRPDDAEFCIASPVQAAHHLLPALRPLCDVLVVLSHLGYSLGANTATVLSAGDVELAESLPHGSVHAIVGGHTHHVLNEQGLSADNIVNGIPIVQAGAMGRFLGVVDITLNPDAAVSNARLTPTADLPADEGFERKEVQPLLERVRPLFTRRLGRVAERPDLSTDAIRNDFAAGESALANFITDALAARCRAAGHPVDFAMIDASSVRCGLPVGGELTFGDWFNLMPFADTVRLYQLTGRQLKTLLEDNALRADRPDEPHAERGFLQFSRQIRYTIELGADRCSAQAANITVDGVPLDAQLERTFLVAGTSFLREAAMAWEGCTARELDLPIADPRDWPHTDTELFVRDAMIAFIREHGGVTEAAGAKRDGRLQVVWDGAYLTRE